MNFNRISKQKVKPSISTNTNQFSGFNLQPTPNPQISGLPNSSSISFGSSTATSTPASSAGQAGGSMFKFTTQQQTSSSGVPLEPPKQTQQVTPTVSFGNQPASNQKLPLFGQSQPQSQLQSQLQSQQQSQQQLPQQEPQQFPQKQSQQQQQQFNIKPQSPMPTQPKVQQPSQQIIQQQRKEINAQQITSTDIYERVRDFTNELEDFKASVAKVTKLFKDKDSTKKLVNISVIKDTKRAEEKMKKLDEEYKVYF